MADLSIINVGGTNYNLKDATARTQIQTLQNSLTGGMHFIGEALQFAAAGPVYIKTGTSTALCYYTGTKPTATTISIGGTTYTLTYKLLTAGDVVISGNLEFIWSDADNTFHEFGSTGSLKALAFKDTATATYKPKGSITNTLNKTNKTLTPTVTQGTVSASATYKPAGTITLGTNGSASFVKSYPGVTSKLVTTTVHDTPTAQIGTIKKDTQSVIGSIATSKLVTTTIQGVSGSTTASKASANSFAGVTASVSGETLTLTSNTLTFTNITVPIAQSAKTVATGSVASTGTGAAVATGGTAKNITFIDNIINDDDNTEVEKVVVDLTEGTAKTVATGSLSAQGTGSAVLTGLGTPTTATAITSIGTPTFNGTQATITVSGSTSGVAVSSMSISTIDSITSTFAGTQETITVS